MPITSFHLFLNSGYASHMIHPGICSPVLSLIGFNHPIISQSPSSSSIELNQPLSSHRVVCFRNFSRNTHTPPLKTPHMPSPACFNYSIVFENLLLELSRANQLTPIVLDHLYWKLHSLPSSTMALPSSTMAVSRN